MAFLLLPQLTTRLHAVTIYPWLTPAVGDVLMHKRMTVLEVFKDELCAKGKNSGFLQERKKMLSACDSVATC